MTPLLTSEQVVGWKAYWELEPFGPLRRAHLAAAVAIACLMPHRKKNAQALTPADVFPELGNAPAKRKLPTSAEIREKIRAWAKRDRRIAKDGR